MRRTITFLSYLFGLTCVFAQLSSDLPSGQEVKFEVAEFPRGPSNMRGIQQVYQDSTGYLWICTIEGLWRWDGYHFKSYQHNPFDSTTLSHNHLENLLFDRQGKIWVGTLRGGVNLFDPLTETFQRFPFAPNSLDGTSAPHIHCMEEDRNGNIWIGTGNGLNRLDRESMQFTHFFHDSTDNTSLAPGLVLDIHEDQQGRLWITTSEGGLNRFDPQTKSFIHYQHDPEDSTSLVDNRVGFLLEDRMGRFWVSSFKTLNLMDRETGTFKHFSYDPTQLNNPSFQNGRITSIIEDQSGIIWLSSLREGLHSYNPITSQVKVYTHNPSNPNSVSQDDFWRLSQSQDGTVWAGGGIFGKLNRTRSKRQIFQTYNLDELPPQTNRVNAYLHDREGRLWLGTSGSGLIQYDLGKGIQQQFLNRPEDPSSIRKNIVRVLFEDSDGYIWIGLGGNQALEVDRMYVDRMDPKTKKITHILEGVSWKNTMKAPNPILDIEEDLAGFIWITTLGEGLLRVDKRTGQYTSFKHDPNIKNTLGGNQVFTIIKNDDESFWIRGFNSTTNQSFLDKFNPSTQQFVSILLKKSGGMNPTLISDHRGHIWFDFSIEEFCEVNPFNKTVTYHAKTSGINLSYPATSLLHITDGQLWMIENGLERLAYYDIPTNSFRYISQERFYGKNSNYLYHSPDGDLFISKESGFSVLKKAIWESYQQQTPKVIITDFALKNKSQSTVLDKPIEKTAQIILGYEDNSFNFRFSSMEFNDPASIQYEYQLVGYDDEWRRTGIEPLAQYTNVPQSSESYIFQARAANALGIWGDPIQIEVIIHPPWWQTIWAYVLYAILAGLSIWGFIQWRTYSLRRQRELLRTRIAEQTQEILNEKQRSDELLFNILPTKVAQELKTTGTTQPVFFEEVSIMFADFKGFTNIVASIPGKKLITELDDIFRAYDDIMEDVGLEKIQTVGDAYLAAGGIPSPDPEHAKKCVIAGQRIIDYLAARNLRETIKWNVRIGIHSGPISAGVIGKKKFSYNLFGDTINIAARIESASESGRINVSAYTADLIKDHFPCTYRGKISAKGKGELDMYYVDLEMAKNPTST